MIEIRNLKENKEQYLTGFANKGYELDKEVNEVIELNDQLLALLQQESDTRAQLNAKTKEIKENPDKIAELKEEASKLSDEAKKITSEVSILQEKINSIASHFPQLPSDEVVIGKTEDDNKVISEHGNKQSNNSFAKPHWELMEQKGLTLDEEAGQISGARQVYYSDKLTQLVRAVEQYFLDSHKEQGVKLVEPAVIVNEEALYNTGQLPKFGDDLYKVTENQYLIPTAEVPLTNLVANKLLKEEELPMEFTANTSCFRKEAGSAGKDTRGIIRLHQFRKVELVTIGKPEDEEKDFNNMLNRATSLLDGLELPYRLVELCTGDMSFTAKRTVDIEVWMPGVDTYREISSVSKVGDFQARRMKARYKDSEGKKSFVYTYNGSALAVERTIAAILENYQQEDGTISVPTVLQKYLDFTTI